MAYIAGTSAVAPSGPRLLLETFKLTNAPLSLLSLMLCVVLGVLDFTYLYCSQVATMRAPPGPNPAPLKFASVMPFSNVAGVSLSPIVNLDITPLSSRAGATIAAPSAFR